MDAARAAEARKLEAACQVAPTAEFLMECLEQAKVHPETTVRYVYSMNKAIVETLHDILYDRWRESHPVAP